METLLEKVIAYFEQTQVKFYPTENPQMLQTQFKGANGIWFCYLYLANNPPLLIFHSICPVLTPPPKLGSMAEYLTRINYNLLVGNFDLDFNNGQVRFKTVIDLENAHLPPSLVQNKLFPSLATMDAHLPAIMKLIYTDTTPLELSEKEIT